jgi:hypothetical protein
MKQDGVFVNLTVFVLCIVNITTYSIDSDRSVNIIQEYICQRHLVNIVHIFIYVTHYLFFTLHV